MKNYNLSIKLGILAIYIFISNELSAKNYYVDPSSTVTITNGTITNPWKTIAQVNAGTTTLLPGDSVLFKKGQIFSGRLVISSSGSSTKSIVYSSYGTGNMPEFTYTASDLITLTNRQYVTIDGFKMIDRTMSVTDHSITAKISYAIILNNSPHNTIRNCDISLVGIAITTEEGSDFTTIENNNIYNLRAVRNTVGGDDDYGANAMVIGTSSNYIHNNIFKDCWALSYDYGYDGGAVEFYGSTISDNIISNNAAINCNGFIEIGSGNYGIATNNLISYNKILNCGTIGAFHNKIDGFSIRTDNLKIYNNVIVDTKKQFNPITSMFWYADPTKVDVVIMKNNIIWLTTGENVVSNNLNTAKMVHTNNIYKLRQGTLGVTLDPTEQIINNSRIFLDTLGDPENWDFRIPAGSPAINFGTNLGLTSDFVGNLIIDKPDAGIFEYQTVAVHQTKYYVDPSSTSNLADGSFSSPWKTIAQVNAGTTGLLPGDSVLFKRSQTFTGTLVVGGSGTLLKPLVYTSYGTGAIPIFTNTTTNVITITNKQYVIVDGIKITDNTISTTDHSIQAKISYGITLSNSPNCTLRNLEITLVGIGISIENGSTNTLITGNNIYNLRSVVNTVGGTFDFGANAMVIGSSNNKINNNRFEGCWATSYDYGFIGGTIQLYNSAINDNIIEYNSAINCASFIEIGGESNGTALNNLIAYNKIINCGQTAIFHNSFDGNYTNTNNTKFYNNVIIETKIQFKNASTMFWFADPTKNDVVIMKNNIIWLATGENVVSNNLDTNKMVHTNNIYKLRNSILGVNLNPTELIINNSQIFVDTLGDPENWDYRLIANSPGINFGTDVGILNDFINNPIVGNPDAGIYENIITPPIVLKKYYADPSSTSAITDGSFANPWKTIAQVNAGTTNLNPGDSVFFKKGQSFTGSLQITGIGNAISPIVYSTYGIGNKPELTVTTGDVIDIVNGQYIIVDGLKILDKTIDTTNHTTTAKIQYGIVIQNSPYCTIRNNDISLVGIGITFEFGSDFTTISNNYIHNLRAVRNTVGGTDDYGANGLVIGSSFNQIQNNKIDGAWASSYDFSYIGGAIQLFNSNINSNRILYNTVSYCKGFMEIGGESNGNAINNLIAYNKIINCGQLATIHNGIDGSFINTNNTRIFNNVIVETEKGFNTATSLFWFADPTLFDIIILRNNIIWATSGINVMNNNLDTLDLIHTNNIYKLRGGTLGINARYDELITDTQRLFIDTTGRPENWNYKLVNGSVAINFGADVGLTRDFIGNAIVGKPDAGIIEDQNIVVIQPLNASISSGTINCYGGTTNIIVSASGGTAPYIGTGTFPVIAGTYTYIVTDALGKKDTVSTTISQPTKLELVLNAGILTSTNTSTTITATATGGTIPYTYKLNNNTPQSSNLFTNITAGTYSVTVIDTKSCTISKSITIAAPIVPPVIASISSGTINCFGGTTYVNVSATGGTLPYSGTGIFTVGAGTYTYIVTDALGKKDTVSTTITQPTKLNLSLSAGLITSFNSTTTITATATGGTTPYTYQLNNNAFQSSNLFYNNYAGTYDITVKDAKACTNMQTITISITPITENPDRRLVLSVYPNPSASSFTVSTIKYRGSYVTMKLQVFNSSGFLVYAAQGMSNVRYTFGANFQPGTYTLLAQVDGTYQAVQLIKL